MERGEGIAAESMISARLLNEKHEESAPAAGDGAIIGDAGIAEQLPKSTTEEVIEAMSQPAGVDGKKKKTKTVRVKQEYIGLLLADPDTLKPYRPMTQELLDKADPELREIMARVTAKHDEIRNMHADFLEQYRTKGYAEEEIEVGDDDDEEAVGN